MKRFVAVLAAVSVLVAIFGANAYASSAASNAGETEYVQKTTVPVVHHKNDSGVEGTNAGSGSGNSGSSGNSGGGNSGDIASTSSAGTSGVAGLPFTGLNLLALAGFGALLVGAGFAQRRFVADRRQA